MRSRAIRSFSGSRYASRTDNRPKTQNRGRSGFLNRSDPYIFFYGAIVLVSKRFVVEPLSDGAARMYQRELFGAVAGLLNERGLQCVEDHTQRRR